MAGALVAIAAVAALVPASVRWLRVAQREHYLAGSVGRFGMRWWSVTPWNPALALVAVGALVAGWPWRWAALGAAAAVTIGPVGLSPWGRTARLVWTRRMKTLAATVVVLVAIAGVIGALASRAGWALAAAGLAMPALVDLALLVLAPVERRLGRKWVEQARRKLDAIDPIRVAITGSYGKTTTKEYVRHLLGRWRSVMASPASFNNAMGLARAVNEHLAPGTEVFVAEMGTYGPGEIADMVAWVRPTVAVITAIGPVHLERFGSEDNIVAAKSEIAAGARHLVVNVDDRRLAAVADRAAAAGTAVVRCSTEDRDADVCLVPEPEGGAVLLVGGRQVARIAAPPALPGNAACAVAVAVALGVPLDDMGEALGGLSRPEHRQTVHRSASGVTFVDDSYNSNPAGARAALDLLAGLGTDGGRTVVVTPGMVELGRRQRAENEAFAAAAAAAATDVLVVGRANRKALLAGAARGPARVATVADRDEAAAWIRDHLGDGDVVLYENDLPDHYP